MISNGRKLTGSQKLDANERREWQFTQAEGRCLVCGGWLKDGVPQLAHRVINSKRNQKLLPPDVLHHPINTLPVCSLRCNSAVIVRRMGAVVLLERIRAVLSGRLVVDIAEEYAALREEFHQRRGGVYE